MKKILISMLGQESDIISASHYISSLKVSHPHSEINILTLLRYTELINILNNIDNVYFIDQNDISTTLKSDIYSDAFALNSFFNTISPCVNTQWDIFCNYSNDLASSYIASMIDAKEKFGTSIAKEGNPLTSNIWANYQNFAMPKQAKHFLNRHLLRHEMSQIDYMSSSKRLLSNPSLDSRAFENINKIKFYNSITEKKIIAINIEHSFNGAMLKENALTSLIEDVKLDETVEVIIITKGTAKETQLVNSLNSSFNNSIVSVNAKIEALPSVIKNIDLFISLENSTLLIADALNVKCIEIKEHSLSQASFLLNEGYSVYANDYSTIKNDLSFIINQELDTTLSVDKISSANKTYMNIKDDYSLLETQVNGTIEIEKEVMYHMTRYYHLLLLNKKKSDMLIEHLKGSVSKETILNVSNRIKVEIEEALSITLSAIRNAPMAHNSKAHAQNLLQSLDQINEKSNANTISSVAFSLFEGKLENLPSGNQEQNLQDITNCLFELKSDIQKLVSIIEALNSKKEYNIRENQI